MMKISSVLIMMIMKDEIGKGTYKNLVKNPIKKSIAIKMHTEMV